MISVIITFITFFAKTITYFEIFLFHFVKAFIFNNDLIALEIYCLHLYFLVPECVKILESL